MPRTPRQATQIKAYELALQRLRDAHWEEFQLYYLEEKARLGVLALQPRKRKGTT